MSGVIEWLSNPGHAAFIAVAISILSLIGSAIAWTKSQRTQNRLLAIEEARERDRTVQMQKASLVARLEHESVPGKQYKRHFLQIENMGSAEARDITVILDGKSLLEHPTIHRKTKEKRHLGPHSSFQYQLHSTLGISLPSEVEITWSDDSGELGNYHTSLG